MIKQNTKHKTARDLIIKSAFKTYGKFGFYGASTREIARQAGVSQGLVTYHFKTKKDLWCAAADYIFNLLYDAMSEPIDTQYSNDPKEARREELRRFVRFAAKYPELHHFMIKMQDDEDGRLKWLTDKHLKPSYKDICKSFSDAPEHMIPHIFYSTIGAGSLLFAVGPVYEQLTGLNPKSKDVIEAHAEFVSRLLIP